MKQNLDMREKEAEVAALKKTKRSRTSLPLIIVGTLLLAATTAAAGYFYKQVTDLKKTSATSNSSPDANQALIDAVAKLILVPPQEVPAIATVTDPGKLKDQVFFTNAAVGDKVLIYNNSKKVILYRPTDNKIIEVAPLNASDPANAPASEPNPTPPSSVSGDSTDNIRGTTPTPSPTPKTPTK